MERLIILRPKNGEKSYQIAASEFQRLYFEVTGRTLSVVTEDDGISDVIIIGSDTVNHFVANLILEHKFDGFQMRYGTDHYNILSLKLDNRNYLLVAGARGRSTIYAVYDFFEKQAGCRYFWDGDIIPKAENIEITGIDIVTSPHFTYRGLRYFAHRSLHRFQAEHWSFEDWQREIDWMMKKRLNIFMLRIGNDDLFQKAFPDIVPYPAHEGKLCEEDGDYNDRTLFWPLEYRGQLRKMLLQYAFDRDLMHPEDCGTITHWYTPTPQEFLDKIKPKTFIQSDCNYLKPKTLVWDIREDENFEYYFKLTDTHINEYGRPELFHTIGFAERLFSNDRDKNLRMKLYVYKKVANYLKEHYKNSPLLIASWDLWMFYTPEEVQKLLSELDPDQSIILDYTSDTMRDSNFTKWGVIGKFPWIFGIFHGYEPNSEIRGNYDLTEERIAIAKEDDLCKGMIFWPELSHSDTFMLEFFASNAWSPIEMPMNERIIKFCHDRYRFSAEVLTKLWQNFMPIIKLMSWSTDNTITNIKEHFLNMRQLVSYMSSNSEDYIHGFNIEKALCYVSNAVEILEKLATLDKKAMSDEFIRRDVFDISRTVCGRYLHLGLILLLNSVKEWKSGCGNQTHILNICDRCLELMELLAKLLSGHEDYSMYVTLGTMERVFPVNSSFEETLKNNASNGYCRSYIYENALLLYLPEMKLVFDWLKRNIDEDNRSEFLYADECMQELKAVVKHYFDTPLEQTAKHGEINLSDILRRIAEKIKKITI